MARQRKITLTFLDDDLAKTEGWPLHYVGLQLGIWQTRTEAEVHNLLQNGLDTGNYQLSPVWIDGRKTARVHLAGYSIREQLDTVMEKLSGSGSEDAEVTFFSVLKEIGFKAQGQTDVDIWKTVLHNIDPRWLGSLQDKNQLSQFNSETEPTSRLPLLPSAQEKMFRSGFDINMVVPKNLIE